jgi:predicted metallo-beta-lactamase superfamily hydrolase
MKYSIIPIIFAILCIFITGSIAHPADSLLMNIDSNGLLTIQIHHPVKDQAKHYINKVIVELNGKEIIQQSFKSQTDKTIQELVYKIIDAKENDKITVTTYCNITGKKKETLTLTRAEEPETEQEK